MIERLITALRGLAASPESGRSPRTTTAGVEDDLALEFADALLLIFDCPQILLTARQRDALQALEAELQKSEIIANGRISHTAVRELAEKALEALGCESGGISITL